MRTHAIFILASLALALAPALAACDDGGGGTGGGPDILADAGDTSLGACQSNLDCQGKVSDLPACQVVVCNIPIGQCAIAVAPEHAPCQDADPCTVESWCEAGACTGASSVVPDCDDGNPCTGDGCQPGQGCVHSKLVAPCDDGNPCTDDDACQEGACVGLPSAQCSCSVDADCAQFDDADLCNGTLRCVLGQCQINPVTVITCPPAGPCASAECNPLSGECSNVPFADGEACSDRDGCTADDQCQGGVCVGVPQCACEIDDDCAIFEDGDLCNGVMACLGGFCSVDPDSTVDCGDDDPGDCLEAACEPSTGKCETLIVEDGTDCADDGFCLSGRTCQSGECTGGDEIDCDDGNPCTLDVCLAAVGCEHQPAPGKSCDDGDPCTSGDTCNGTVCVGPTNACVCGDGFCAASEDCIGCPIDCGECGQCGNGVCDATEDINTCPQDCTTGGTGICGDFFCDAGENLSCPQDCGGSTAVCGDGFCDGAAFEILSCPQDCCGDGVCDAIFEDDQICPDDCAGLPPSCGFGILCNGICEPGLDDFLCPDDCCGDSICSPSTGEDGTCCPSDCGPVEVCGDGTCEGSETEASCPDDCVVVADPGPETEPDAGGDVVAEDPPDAGGDAVAEEMSDAGDAMGDTADVAETMDDAVADTEDIGPTPDADAEGDAAGDVEGDAAEDAAADGGEGDAAADVEADAAEDAAADAEPEADGA